MRTGPRVAFFPDCFIEINGVARTSAALDAFARRRGLPFLSVYGGPALRDDRTADGGGALQLPRGPVALRLEADLTCDLLFWRHARRVRRALAAFRPDVIHITGPNDVGQLGAWLAWRLGIPLVASWHTNVHEFGARRLARGLGWVPGTGHGALVRWIERRLLDLAVLFYRIPRVLLAPNAELVSALQRLTGKPTLLMPRGIDADLFHPARRDRRDDVFRIGYVGRLSPEKNVRMLPRIERALVTRGSPEFRFVVVGHGREREPLEAEMAHALFPGVVQGEDLARTYADMDAFVFPSETDTFGLVVLEALSSGVPAVVSPFGGPKAIIEDGVSGLVAGTTEEFADALLTMMRQPSAHRRMREAARARALEWSWDRAFEPVIQAYLQAIGMHAPHPPGPAVHA